MNHRMNRLGNESASRFASVHQGSAFWKWQSGFYCQLILPILTIINFGKTLKKEDSLKTLESDYKWSETGEILVLG